MARKRRGAKRRRRSPKAMFNLVTLATTMISLNSFSQYVFGNNIGGFLFGKKYGNQTIGYGNYQPGNKLSLMELLNINQLSTNPVSAVDQMRNNVMREGALAQFVATQIGVIVVPKLIRKTGVTRRFNALTKQIGLNTIVKA
jgi:hypothetical protein